MRAIGTQRPARLTTALLVVLVGLSGCGDGDGDAEPVIDPGDGGDYAPAIDAADFVDEIDNPYLPLLPGTRWVYEGIEDGEIERIEVEVTDERREVMGISAIVVRDTVYEDGELIEDTYDWFAQDVDGNVWYLGEDSREYEDGELLGTEGSWEAGVDGALPGIVMLATPAVGDAYRQEYYEDEAEDLGEVHQLGVSETVPAGSFDDIVVIREWNPLEPDVVEDKYHAPGVGVILEVKVRGEEGRVELVEFRAPGS
ncbi:MAG: hypothetical protein GWN79_02270 [Actinobacteria bacterium]|nr:hypothetical protein [Actinomycetota bacterium]NIS29166.1 hypothetical protein [Actinomycetota bacterium]NIT94380.1 hypothetical protein [Actinomycetota bacterium]NIU17984.1 hypothetical protein [Actinomycetota bacterium]NIU64570.1 hypothetical protein [Actinomycetota bacterium]